MTISRVALSLFLGVSSLASAAAAQPSPPAASVSDEIVVTARRTVERLQDVPVAVTAVSGPALEQRNITDLRAVGAIAPGLTIAEANTPSTLILTIRGLANVNPLTGSDATVGFYINEAPINLQSGTNLALYDIDNVQVLKGPQGTLFGRNTTGGALLLNTVKPSDRFEGYVKVGGTFFRVGEGFQGEAALNLPLTDTLALRLAGRLVDRDGFVRNLLPRNAPEAVYGPTPLPFGRTRFEKLLEEKSQAGRASLRWTPDAQLESLLIYDYAHMRGDGMPTFATALNPRGNIVNLSAARGWPDATAAYNALVAARKDYFWTTYEVANVPLYVTTHNLSNTTTYRVSENLTIKNILGYRAINEKYGQDIVGLPGPYFVNATLNKGRDFSEELQVQGRSFDGRLNWVAGLFYFEEVRSFLSWGVAFGNDKGRIDFDTKSRSYSAFAQGSYRLTDALSLTLGGRYNWDKRSATLTRFVQNASGGIATCQFLGGSPTNCFLAAQKSFDAFTYTASLDYKLDPQTLLYAATRRGYRAGGFSNTQSLLTGGFIGFDPETLTDYELGFKRDWDLAGMALRTNAAIYYQDYKDVQRLAVDPADFRNQLIVNASKAHVKGGEIEVTLKPAPWLTLGYSYARVVPEYKNFVVGGVDYTDNTFAYASRNTHNLSLVAEFPVSGGEGGVVVFNADYHYQSKQYYDGLIQDTFNGTYPPGTFAFGGYDMVNLKATWRQVMGGQFDVDVFVNNLTNTKLLPNGTPSTYPTLGAAIGFYGVPPRMAGFNVRYNF